MTVLLGGIVLFSWRSWLAYQDSRREALASAALQRDAAAEEAARRVSTYLNTGDVTLQALERQVAAGTCDVQTLAGAEQCLFSMLLVTPELTELGFTHATRRGYSADGEPALGQQDRWRISLYRRGAPNRIALCVAATQRHGDQYVNHTRCGAEGLPLEAFTPEADTPVADPTEWPGFTTPAKRGASGVTLTTDLCYLEIDSALPQPQRRIGFHALRAVEEGGVFRGVFRASLLRQQIDAKIDSVVVDTRLPEAEDRRIHRKFLVDFAGRLVTSSGPDDSVQVMDDDLRVAAAHPDAVLKATLKTAGEVEVPNDDKPVILHRPISADGESWDLTLRPLEKTQGWAVAILSPQDYYVRDLLAQQRRNLVQILLFLLFVVIAGVVGIKELRDGLKGVETEATRVRQFDFQARDAGSPVRELNNVLDSMEHAKTALRAMGKYVPVPLVRELYEANRDPTLGGEMREVSLLFSDVQGFTALSERLSPDELARRLGQYLVAMTDAIHAHQGTVDKFIGDGVMVLWNAPHAVADHPARACRAALACLAATRALFESPAWNGPTWITRFGIHVDQVMVGHFGAPDRMSYTALGDGVNLAARLEGLNKLYGTSVLVSDAVRRRAEPELVFRRIDRVAVKGKQTGVDVFSLVGIAGACRLDEAALAYDEAFGRYVSGDFPGAASLLTPFRADPPSVVLRDRCLAYQAAPPAADWGGVFVAREK